MITYLNLNITLPNSLWIWLSRCKTGGRSKDLWRCGEEGSLVKKACIASIKAKNRFSAVPEIANNTVKRVLCEEIRTCLFLIFWAWAPFWDIFYAPCSLSVPFGSGTFASQCQAPFFPLPLQYIHKTVCSYCLFSALLNGLKLVYGQFRAEQHAMYIQFLPMGRKEGRNQVCTKAEEYSD